MPITDHEKALLNEFLTREGYNHIAGNLSEEALIQHLTRTKNNLSSNAQDHDAPIHSALRIGDLEIINIILKCNININQRTIEGHTSLHLVALYGHKEMVDMLIRVGADKDATDYEGAAPLHWAAKMGNTELVQDLIKAGANIDIRNTESETPLHLAAFEGHREIILALIKEGADKDARDYMKATPLHWLASMGHTELARDLIAAGADKDAKNLQQATPLHIAVLNGHREISLALSAATLNQDAKDYTGSTALHWSARRGDTELVQDLIKAGANMDVRNLELETPLHLAVLNGHKETILALIKMGADKDVKTWQESTPIHCAAQIGNTEAVKALIIAGALLDEKDVSKNTPLDLAIINGHTNIAEALIVAGAKISTVKAANIISNLGASENNPVLIFAAKLSDFALQNLPDTHENPIIQAILDVDQEVFAGLKGNINITYLNNKQIEVLLKLKAVQTNIEATQDIKEEADKVIKLLLEVSAKFSKSFEELMLQLDKSLSSTNNAKELLQLNKNLKKKLNQFVQLGGNFSHMVDQFLPGKLSAKLIAEIANPEVEKITEENIQAGAVSKMNIISKSFRDQIDHIIQEGPKRHNLKAATENQMTDSKLVKNNLKKLVSDLDLLFQKGINLDIFHIVKHKNNDFYIHTAEGSVKPLTALKELECLLLHRQIDNKKTELGINTEKRMRL